MPLREHINVVTGLRAPDPFGHHVIGSLWLSGGSARPTQASDVQAGQTIDQHIADAIGRDTPLRSLELGIEGINTSSNSCQFGWSCLYLNTLSWQTPTMPLPNEINPQNAFERMFGDIGSAEERAARFKSKASILDSVISAASRLNNQLAPQDRSTVEEYLENIREVESRIQAAGQRAEAVGETPDAPAGIPGSYDEHVRVMYDLIALAWRADITRVTTFMNGVEASSIGYPQIGVPESHHIVSHHGGVAASIAKYAKINAYHLSLFGDFVEKLRTTPDGDGSLLDHSLVMYGSGMGNGDKHDQNMVPIVLAGVGRGALEGRPTHRDCEPDALGEPHRGLRPRRGARARQARERHRSRGALVVAASAKIVSRPQRSAAEQPVPKIGGKRERTRKKILEAAFELIGNEKGLTVRIEEVCAAARISRGTFYNYFTSLDQLFEVLAIELSHDLNGALVATWDETQSHAEGGNAAIQHYLNYARRDPAWAWAMVHLNAFGPPFGAESWDACYRAIEQGIEAGEFDVPNAAVGRDLMTGTVMATVRSMLRSGNGRTQPRVVAYHVLRALGVPDARATEDHREAASGDRCSAVGLIDLFVALAFGCFLAQFGCDDQASDLRRRQLPEALSRSTNGELILR